MRIGHGVPLYWVKPVVHSPLPIYGIDRLCVIYWYSSSSNSSNFHPWIQVTFHEWLHEYKALQGYGGQCVEPTLLIRSLIIKKPFAFVCVLISVDHVCVCVCLFDCMSGVLKCKFLYVCVSVSVRVWSPPCRSSHSSSREDLNGEQTPAWRHDDACSRTKWMAAWWFNKGGAKRREHRSPAVTLPLSTSRFIRSTWGERSRENVNRLEMIS